MLAFPVALFPAQLVADITYLNTAEIQWTNFAAWLNAGALFMGGLVGVWAIIDAVLAWRRSGARRPLAYVIALALAWIIGLVNAFKHSQDAWSSVGAFGLTLSILSTVLVLIAGWIAWSGRPQEIV